MLSYLWDWVIDALPDHIVATSSDPLQIASRLISEVITTISYLFIQFLFMKLTLSRKDTKTGPFFWSFVAFTTMCIIVHLVTIWNFWYGYYYIRLLAKISSSVGAIGTVVCLWPLIPRLIAIPTLEEVEAVNVLLQEKVKELANISLGLENEKQEKHLVQTALVQSQKMEAVGQLTGGIAHDFNNILMAISGNLELIQKNPSSDKSPRWITNARNAVDKAAHLTAQLLSFSRVQKLQLKEVFLVSSIDTVRDMVARTIGTDIEVTVHNDHNVIIQADAVQLELALLNLCINARDAMPDGGSLTITTTCRKHLVEIDVTDTGTGISKNIVDKIFEPFFTTKETGKGTGLGLSMVYGVVKQLKGEVFVKQTSNIGTTITIALPVLYDHGDYDVPMETITNLMSVDSKHILLIDDDHVVRETLREMLTSINHHVVDFDNGKAALVYLKTHKPDLILVDYVMPVMNGAAVMKAVRILYHDIPLVFITGFSESAALANQTVLKKPFTSNDIKELLCSIFPN